MSLDGCGRDQEQLVTGTDRQERGLLQWPEVGIGAVARYNCPCNQVSIPRQASRVCMGDFINGGRWMNSDTTPCDFDPVAWEICDANVCALCVTMATIINCRYYRT